MTHIVRQLTAGGPIRRLLIILPVLALALVAFAPSPAAAQTTPDLSCTQAYQSGDPCQGTDQDPSANGCAIDTWVQGASCELAVPGGQAYNLGAGWTNDSDGSDPVWYDIVLRDKATGTVLYETSNPDSGGPVGPLNLWNSNGGNGLGAAYTPFTTDTVVCAISGSHSQYGATYVEARNTFSCTVDN